MKNSILVIDDDQRLRDLLTKYLSEHGFLVSSAADADQAKQVLETLQFDLLILDIMMPGQDGLSLTAELRQKSDVPILLLTARGNTDDRIIGLEAGADDYLPKPFEPKELLLRINSILRRRTDPELSNQNNKCMIGDYVFDQERRILTKSNPEKAIQNDIKLTLTETQLLAYLYTKRNQIVDREELIKRFNLEDDFSRSIDIMITRLRKKMELDPKLPNLIKTIRGRGYQLCT